MISWIIYCSKSIIKKYNTTNKTFKKHCKSKVCQTQKFLAHKGFFLIHIYNFCFALSTQGGYIRIYTDQHHSSHPISVACELQLSVFSERKAFITANIGKLIEFFMFLCSWKKKPKQNNKLTVLLYILKGSIIGDGNRGEKVFRSLLISMNHSIMKQFDLAVALRLI